MDEVVAARAQAEVVFIQVEDRGVRRGRLPANYLKMIWIDA